jgi:hypothetical protein
LTPKPEGHDAAWWKRPSGLGAIVLVLVLILNVAFW